jgi:hypothetical protein
MKILITFVLGLAIGASCMMGLGFRAMYNGQLVSIHQPQIRYEAESADFVTQLQGGHHVR